MGTTKTKGQKKRKRRTPGYCVQRVANGHDLAYVSIDGKRHYLGKYDTPESHEAYHRLIAEWEANDGKLRPAAEDCTIAELCREYVVWADHYYCKPDGTHTTSYGEVLIAVRALRKGYSRMAANEFGPKKLKAIRSGWERQGLSISTVNGRAAIIVRIFKWGVAEELVDAETWRALTAVPGLREGRSTTAKPSRRIPPVDIEVVGRTLPHLSPTVQAMVKLQLATGMRPDEVCRIRIADMDMSDKDVWLYRPAWHKNKWRQTGTGGKHERVVRLAGEAREIIQPLLLNRPIDKPLFSPADSVQWHREQRAKKRKTPIGQGNKAGTNKKSKPKWVPREQFSSCEYRHAIQKGCRKAFMDPPAYWRKKVQAKGRKHKSRRWETDAEWRDRLGPEKLRKLRAWRRRHYWSPNQLRKTAATRFRKEVGLEVAAMLLGHRSATVTMEHYLDNDNSLLDAAAKKVM